MNLSQSSLHLNVLHKCVKFYDWEINIKKDISVQKIKVKKSIYHFMTLSICYYFANIYITHKLR